jgi:hypothetical protein
MGKVPRFTLIWFSPSFVALFAANCQVIYSQDTLFTAQLHGVLSRNSNALKTVHLAVHC